MFDPKVAVLGVHTGVIMAALGLGGFVVAFLWLRQMFADDPDPQSFYATAGRRSRPPVPLLLGLALLGAVLVFLGLSSVQLGYPAEPRGGLSIHDEVFLAGVSLVLLAAVLFVRRLSGDSRA